MRLGRVEFRISYVVDLDDEEMIEHARQAVFEDINSAAKYDEITAITTIEPAEPQDREEHIAEFLRVKEDDDDR